MQATILFSAVLLCCSGAVQAADTDPPQPQPLRRMHVVMPPLGHGIELGALDHGKLVRNAPYSAEIVNERQQNLADGNQIGRKSTMLSLRDSAGRTRQEVRDEKGQLRLIMLHDPATNTRWILRPDDKSAIKLTMPGPMRERLAQMRKEGHRAGEEIVVKRITHGDGAAVQEQVDVRVDAAAAARERLGHVAPALVGAFADMKWAAKANTRDLGTREIDGVKAQGKLRSYEIPAGEIGNRNAIVVSDETWYAPELQITLLSKHSDPRSGDVVFRVEKLRREEPAAALFTVPSDYTVKEPLAGLEKRIEQRTERRLEKQAQ